MQGHPSCLLQLCLPLLWDVSPLVAPNTGELTVPCWCFPPAQLGLALGNGLKTGDSQALSVWSHPKPTQSRSGQLIFSAKFPENAQAVWSLPREVWLNHKPVALWVTDTEESETIFLPFFPFFEIK